MDARLQALERDWQPGCGMAITTAGLLRTNGRTARRCGHGERTGRKHLTALPSLWVCFKRRRVSRHLGILMAAKRHWDGVVCFCARMPQLSPPVRRASSINITHIASGRRALTSSKDNLDGLHLRTFARPLLGTAATRGALRHLRTSYACGTHLSNRPDATRRGSNVEWGGKGGGVVT